MSGKFEASRSGGNGAPKRRRRKKRSNLLPAAILILFLVILIVLIPWSKDQDAQDPSDQAAGTGQETASDPTETEPSPVRVETSATISSQGDLLMHKPIITACKTEENTYDFGSIFRYLKDYTERFDYAVANLETTLGGSDYPYQGNPRFNCPDPFADAVADAGFDMLLTANNHSSDTYTDGILRTVTQLRERGLATLGTQLNNEESKYTVVDLNGIQVGMLCYTYATNENGDGYPSLNYKEFVTEPGIVNYFMYNDLEQFYGEVASHLADMKADGADVTMLYIHWGEEYELQENATQRTMAQKLCDLGIDVIVGGHPHVVQPMDLLESTVDSEHKTVCIYSVGNAVSNQMREADEAFASGHSEDGALFTVTFEKYTDGSVRLSAVDVLPTWVLRYEDSAGSPTGYHILPLDISREAQWTQMFSLPEQEFVKAQESWKRTMDIVGEGLAECQQYLQQRSELVGTENAQ